MQPKTIAIANQKGGVGKTTTAVNLATALSAMKKKTLLIDLDPQGNATTGLGLRKSTLTASIYDVLFEEAALSDVAQPTRVPYLSVASSSIHLSGAEIELIQAQKREYKLKNAIKKCQNYDYVLIDCPPALSLLTLNALTAADEVLIPLQCEYYALEGLSQLLNTVKLVRKHFNPDLDINGIVLTMFDPRNNLSQMVENDVRDHFKDQVYRTIIPRNVRLSEAPSHGLPAIVYDMRCAGAQAYIKLAAEVLKREKNNKINNLHKDAA